MQPKGIFINEARQNIGLDLIRQRRHIYLASFVRCAQETFAQRDPSVHYHIHIPSLEDRTYHSTGSVDIHTQTVRICQTKNS